MYFPLYCLKVNHRHELYYQTLKCILPGHQGSTVTKIEHCCCNGWCIVHGEFLVTVTISLFRTVFLAQGPVHNSSLNLVGMSSIAVDAKHLVYRE